MVITSLRLQKFRSYSDSAFEFGNGVNIIVGPNASGKTNLLEALSVAATGKSFRVSDDELVKHDSEWARLDVALADGEERVVRIKTDQGRIVKTIEIDGKEYKRPSLTTNIPIVLFEPNHLLLLHGSPERRRAYLDGLLSQLLPDYGPALRGYQRTLRQRNSLLKQLSHAEQQQFFSWNIQLAQFAETLVRGRIWWIDILKERLPKTYQQIAGHTGDLTIAYDTKLATKNYASSLLAKLEQSLDLDCARGFTGSGPHREDVRFGIHGHSAQDVASRGEIRSLLLSLKSIELHELQRITNQEPILLLDDVFSELDGARRQALTALIADHQAFITTTDADVVVEHFMDRCTIIPL